MATFMLFSIAIHAEGQTTHKKFCSSSSPLLSASRVFENIQNFKLINQTYLCPSPYAKVTNLASTTSNWISRS